MHLERIKQSFSRDDNLPRLLVNWQRSNQSSDFFSSLPFGQLSEPLLSGPRACVDDFQEQSSGPRVEDENGAVNRLCCQVTLESLVNCDSVNVCVVDEPNGLIREQLSIVGRG
jgi:hypothetical protein